MTLGAFAGFLGGFADSREKKKDADRKRSLLDAYEASQKQGAATPAPMDQGGGGADRGAGDQAFTYDGAIGDRPAHAYKRFTEAGLPPHVAAGLTGNLMQESGADIDPAAVGDNGNAFGSGQMNGPRMDGYMAFAKERGVDPTDFDTQIDWMLHEGKTTERGAWDAIMATKSPEEAALVASSRYWRPGTPHNARRQGYATSVYAAQNKPAAQHQIGVRSAPEQMTEATPTDWPWFRKYKGTQ